VPPGLSTDNIQVLQFVDRIAVVQPAREIVTDDFTGELVWRIYPGGVITVENLVQGFCLSGRDPKADYLRACCAGLASFRDSGRFVSFYGLSHNGEELDLARAVLKNLAFVPSLNTEGSV
jgi:hypothetical protein